MILNKGAPNGGGSDVGSRQPHEEEGSAVRGPAKSSGHNQMSGGGMIMGEDYDQDEDDEAQVIQDRRKKKSPMTDGGAPSGP